jgi:hypothetical protein
MKAVCIAIGITGLCVVAALGQQSATPGIGRSGRIQPTAPVVTQNVAQASNTVAAAPVAVAAGVVSTPVAVTSSVVVLEAPTQAVACVAGIPVATPFTTKFTARTPADITNALIRWGAWTPGEKDGTFLFPTDRAVLAALNWLQREQQADGSWKGSKEIVTPTLTALALLAYLGHGETPASARYGTNVTKAIKWLLENQEESGRFKGRDARDYTHPIAALALAEAYGMTLDPDVKVAAGKAIALIVKGQHPGGGFSYNLDKAARDDTSFMSWCAQALVTARMAGVTVPGLERAIEKTSYALRQNADPKGGFGESRPGRTSVSGAGVVGLQFLRAPHVAEVQKTLEFLSTNTFRAATEETPAIPGASRFYISWNLTQAKFQAGEEAFRAWNKALARELADSQTRQRNLITKWVELGHWERQSANDPKEVVIQDTCYGALMLEVYYRYLPLGK